MNSICGGKRKFEETPFEPEKRLEIEQPCFFEDIPAEVAGHVFSFLAPKDLLRCDAVSKIFSFYLLANRSFEDLIKKEYLNLEWFFSRQSHNSAKINYVVNYFLKKFLKKFCGPTCPDPSSFQQTLECTLLINGINQIVNNLK